MADAVAGRETALAQTAAALLGHAGFLQNVRRASRVRADVGCAGGRGPGGVRVPVRARAIALERFARGIADARLARSGDRGAAGNAGPAAGLVFRARSVAVGALAAARHSERGGTV